VFEAFHAVVQVAARAQNQNRRAGAPSADALENLEAVHIGQHQVQNHQIVIGIVGELQRRSAVRSHIDGVTGSLQTSAEEIRDSFLVFDNEDTHVNLAYLSVFFPLRKGPRHSGT
jgi:hypothetical protein